MNEEEIKAENKNYYLPKIKEFGATYKAVDWNSEKAQELSFEQLIKIISPEDVISGKYSLLDYGCGYGALLDFLISKNMPCEYFGYDVMRPMIDLAKETHKEKKAVWLSEFPEEAQFDYVLASGVFTLKMKQDVSVFKTYVQQRLKEINKISKKGFAFNCLTSYSDKEFMKDYLYYPSPLETFDFCKKNFSSKVALLHDYPKYEFTILVRKDI
jgi:SAM-dependent methyltransferase